MSNDELQELTEAIVEWQATGHVPVVSADELLKAFNELAVLRHIVLQAHALLSSDNTYNPSLDKAWSLLGIACGKISSGDAGYWGEEGDE